MVTARDLLSKKYVKVELNDTVSKLLGKFRRANEYNAIVLDNGKYKGSVQSRFLLSSKLDPRSMKVKNAIKHRSKTKSAFYVPTLKLNDNLLTMCKKMCTAKAKVLPVLDGKKVLGVVHAKDLICEILPKYPIACEKLATMKAVCVNSTDKISKAVTLFARHKISHLPVVDDKNKMIGMLSLSDLLGKANFWQVHSQGNAGRKGSQSRKQAGQKGEKTKMSSLSVSNFMSTKDVLMCSPARKISLCAKQMLKANTGSIVLGRYREPIGVMTIHDMLKDYSKR